MPDVEMTLYEGLFLMDQGAVASDFGGCVEHIKEILHRADAEVLVLRKWDERKLAYDIANQKRGTFLLAYFKARGTQIPNIDRDCNLSELVLRSLVLKADHVGEVELEAARKEADLSLEVKLRRSDDEDATSQSDAPQADAGADRNTPAESATQPPEPAAAE